MTVQATDRQLSDEQSRQVAATVREELARRRISRQHLAERLLERRNAELRLLGEVLARNAPARELLAHGCGDLPALLVG